MCICIQRIILSLYVEQLPSAEQFALDYNLLCVCVYVCRSRWSSCIEEETSYRGFGTRSGPSIAHSDCIALCEQYSGLLCFVVRVNRSITLSIRIRS